MSTGRRWPAWLTEMRLTLEAVSYVAAALGLFFAGFQILEANRARSIDATLSYLRVLNEDPLAGMQRQITDRWLEHRETLAAIQSGAISAPNIASFTLGVKPVLTSYAVVPSCRRWKRPLRKFACRTTQANKRLPGSMDCPV